MAKERGAFTVYDTKREVENPFIKRIKEADPALYEEMKNTDGAILLALPLHQQELPV